MFNSMARWITASATCLLINACGFSAAYQQASAQLQAQEARRTALASNLPTHSPKSIKDMSPQELATYREQAQKKMALQRTLNVGEDVSVEYATALLLGTWKGSTCKGRVGVEVTYTDVLPTTERNALHLRGVFRAVDLSEPSDARAFMVDLDSYFSLSRGFLAAKSIAKPTTTPTPEESAQEARLLRQESLEYAALARKRQELLTKQYTEKKDSVIQEYQARDKVMAEQMEALRAQQAQRIASQSAKTAAAKAAAQAALVQVQFDVARNGQGTGWAGISKQT